MEERGEKALRSFYDDFRRALLMHRKGRLRLFFKLLFRNDEPDYHHASAPQDYT